MRPSRLRCLCLLPFGLFFAGCLSEPEKPPASPGDGTYRVRGTIVALPSSDRPHLLVQHEAVPDFRDERGEIVGMDAMTMPFPLAPGLQWEGLAVGDHVELTFEVRWNARKNRFQAIHVSRLPKP